MFSLHCPASSLPPLDHRANHMCFTSTTISRWLDIAIMRSWHIRLGGFCCCCCLPQKLDVNICLLPGDVYSTSVALRTRPIHQAGYVTLINKHVLTNTPLASWRSIHWGILYSFAIKGAIPQFWLWYYHRSSFKHSLGVSSLCIPIQAGHKCLGKWSRIFFTCRQEIYSSLVKCINFSSRSWTLYKTLSLTTNKMVEAWCLNIWERSRKSLFLMPSPEPTWCQQ